jgi:hypothetical protein
LANGESWAIPVHGVKARRQRRRAGRFMMKEDNSFI